jgi:putative NADPH-quinone reductase
MRIHLVYAHPVPESFNAACRDAVIAALEAGGHEIDLLDLYAEGFDPVLSADERRAYHDIGANIATVEDLVARLRAADALVLVFPTWWYGLPAILKGWFDRVWAPGVSFTLSPDGGPIRPALTNIKKLAVVTTTGAPKWFTRLYMREPVKRVVLRGLKTLCAPKAEQLWLCHYAMDASTDATRKAFLTQIGDRFGRF